VDFCYYWFHRASHRINFLWAGHAVHHQSEHYNLSVALRQGVVQSLFSWICYLPLALLGFPTWMFLIMSSLNTLYQFWIHTEFIKRMGWFEILFNTPSHHRVHHGKNLQYIDKNYGGSLIIWDKLFGTYEREDAPSDYGTTEPLNSWDPFFANVKTIIDIVYYGKHLTSVKNKILVFFMPPDWVLHKISDKQQHQQKVTRGKKSTLEPKAYILVNLFLAIAGYSYCLMTYSAHVLLSWLLGSLILITLYNIGMILNGEQRIHYLFIELVRTILFSLVIYWLLQDHVVALITAILFFVSNCYLFDRGLHQCSRFLTHNSANDP
jgi:hypothetical protein